MPRARILGLDIRKRIKVALELYRKTGGKSMLDVPHEMHDCRMLMRQLADDAQMLLDALKAEHETHP